ncbi:uncharacterized protein AB675_5511 [Cyphellophora attinorum]|uniref:BTB domain-containing protein n=1 Tax=Cyphellophora attinorum TaxID=1664694 RepID=A0A0N1HCZ0_9EURO|nr:uncharacterized protein AB675_5511 [Phialophora attinorum]KPI41946.1 hypothetical protein AB675_5511 [Phialophora attinorum]
MGGLNDSRLVFEDGDVVIHTSHEPSGIFLVHKEVLISGSPYFRNLLSELWGTTPHVVDTGTTPVFELDLQMDCQSGFALPIVRKQGHDLLDPSESVESDKDVDELVLWPEQPQTPKSVAGTYLTRSAKLWPHSKVYASLRKPMDQHVTELKRKLLDRDTRWYFHAQEHRFPKHEHALSYVRAIWRCIIRLLYGKDRFLEPQGKKSPAKQVMFLANLYAYAELLDLDNTIMTRLRNAVRSVPSIWILVSKKPDIFIDLANAMEMPDLYTDAMKHWISWQVSPHQYRRWHSVGGEGTFRLLAHAAIKHQSALMELSRSIVNFTLYSIHHLGIYSYATSIPLLPCKMFPRGYSDGDRTEIDYYLAAVKDLFVTGLIPVATSLHLELYRNMSPWDSTSNMTSAQVLRALMILGTEPLENQGRKAIISFFNLRRYANLKQLRLDKLTYLVGLTLKEYKDLLEDSPAFCPESKYHNRHGAMWLCRCPGEVQPKYPTSACLCIVNLHEVFARGLGAIDPQPWPFNQDVSQDNECAEFAQTQTKPATFAYLQSVGLGSKFSYLNRARQGSPELLSADDLAIDADGCNLDIMYDG